MYIIHGYICKSSRPRCQHIHLMYIYIYMYGISLGVTHKSNKMNAYTYILIRLKDLLKYYIYRLNICI